MGLLGAVYRISFSDLRGRHEAWALCRYPLTSMNTSSRVILYMYGTGEVNDKIPNSQINSVYCQITIKDQRNSVKYGRSLANLWLLYRTVQVAQEMSIMVLYSSGASVSLFYRARVPCAYKQHRTFSSLRLTFGFSNHLPPFFAPVKRSPT